jgi:cytochrome c-type biogenesis protein
MGLSTFFVPLGLGLLAIVSPCVLPLYPGFLAYLSGGHESGKTRYFLGIFVLLGVLTMMLLLSSIIALFSISVGRALSVLVPGADGVIIALGLLLLFNKNPFQALPQIQVPVLHNPFFNAWIYGMLYGPIAMPCSGPFLVGLFTYSLSSADVIAKLSLFLWFGLGFGLPLFLMSFLSGALQRSFTRWIARHTLAFNRIGGVMLVAIGIYDFIVNWSLIRIFLHI